MGIYHIVLVWIVGKGYMMKIRKNEYLSILIFTIFNIVLILILILSTLDIKVITYLSTIQLIVALILLYISKKRILSVANIFLLLSYLFHFGQAIIIAYGFNDIYAHRSVLAITSSSLYIQAMYFAMLSHYFITIGVIWSKPSKKVISITNINEDQMLNKLKVISLIVLGVSFIPLIYLDIYKIIAVKSGGYLST